RPLRSYAGVATNDGSDAETRWERRVIRGLPLCGRRGCTWRSWQPILCRREVQPQAQNEAQERDRVACERRYACGVSICNARRERLSVESHAPRTQEA